MGMMMNNNSSSNMTPTYTNNNFKNYSDRGNQNNDYTYQGFSSENAQQFSQTNQYQNPFDIGVDGVFGSQQPQQPELAAGRTRKKIFDDDDDIRMREEQRKNMQLMRDAVGFSELNFNESQIKNDTLNFWDSVDAQKSNSNVHGHQSRVNLMSDGLNNMQGQYQNINSGNSGTQNHDLLSENYFNNSMPNHSNQNSTVQKSNEFWGNQPTVTAFPYKNDQYQVQQPYIQQQLNKQQVEVDPWAQFSGLGDVQKNQGQLINIQNGQLDQNQTKIFGGDGFLEMDL